MLVVDVCHCNGNSILPTLMPKKAMPFFSRGPLIFSYAREVNKSFLEIHFSIQHCSIMPFFMNIMFDVMPYVSVRLRTKLVILSCRRCSVKDEVKGIVEVHELENLL